MITKNKEQNKIVYPIKKLFLLNKFHFTTKKIKKKINLI